MVKQPIVSVSMLVSVVRTETATDSVVVPIVMIWVQLQSITD